MRDPGGDIQGNRPAIGREHTLTTVDPHQGQTIPLRGGQHLTGAFVNIENFGAGGWRIARITKAQYAVLDLAATLHARGQFLADITPLVEVNGGQKVKISVNGVEIVRAEIRDGFGQAVGVAEGAPVVRQGGRGLWRIGEAKRSIND